MSGLIVGCISRFRSEGFQISYWLRNITYLRRQYPIRSPQYITINGGAQELTVEQQIYIEGKKEDEDSIIEVLLTEDVPGLGAKGNLVKIHRNRFWNNLYLRKLAELPTAERINELKSQDSNVLYGHSYEAQQRLLNMKLYIPMNPYIPWTLTPKHVKVAFRRIGVVVREEDVVMPEKPITASTLEEFVVNINRILNLFARLSSNEAKARLQTLFSIQREKQWLKKCRKVPLTPANHTALKHFDKYYSHIYGSATWSGIRAALLTPPSKVAVLNSNNPSLADCVSDFLSKNYLDLFIELKKSLPEDSTPSPPPEQTVENADLSSSQKFLVMQSAPEDQLSEFLPPTEFISERDIYTRDSDREFVLRSATDLMRTPDIPMVEDDGELVESLRNLRCLLLPSGVFSALPRPKYSNNCFDFYPLDLGSVLAVLMLNIQPGTRMLDLCSAPGGKAVTALQTLNVERLLCIDVSASRLERLCSVLEGFAFGVGCGRVGIPDVKVSTSISRYRSCGDLYSRVLVDVPCSTDRDALTAPLSGGGYFARGKAAARIALPDTQKSLLLRAMSLCEVGGLLVYSTCTLSTAQNQAVIEACLAGTNKDNSDMKFAVVNPTSFIHLCASRLNPILGIRVVTAPSSSGAPLGALVIPCIAANYGPTFMCKLKRLK